MDSMILWGFIVPYTIAIAAMVIERALRALGINEKDLEKWLRL